MKKFSELSSEEIYKMSNEEFAAVSPFEKKSCADCEFLIERMSLWCSNKEAVSLRGTSLPGVIKCTFWKPDWNRIEKSYKTAENGYVYMSGWEKFKRWLFTK